MGEIKWTEAQERAITACGKNILVAAAAGSGKTAVLVERVIRLVTERNVDLDSLVIMTFTRAAAAQMRKKIAKAIREKLKSNPEDAHLKKQIFKVNTARICTIDSLCLDIVRENFQYVDVDPGFSMGDEAEMSMLKGDIVKKLIERKYDEGDEDFLKFAAYYTDKNDSKIEELILNLYSFAQSDAEPLKWFANALAPYENALNDEGKPNPAANGWIYDVAELVDSRLKEICEMADAGLLISKLPDGPEKYIDKFEEIKKFVKGLDGFDFDSMRYEIISYIDSWQSSPRYGKNEEVNVDLKEYAKEQRSSIKKKLEGIRNELLFQDLESNLKDMKDTAPIARTLVNLAREFNADFSAAKKERKILDFNDVAHFALKILIEYDDKGCIVREQSSPKYTAVADSLSKDIYEIIVDEYQDTNDLQEELIRALSGERFGRPNVFMVGDVKQSIYGFRMARPELFNHKYNNYGKGLGKNEKIILDSNFRSRKEIIDFTNFIFGQAMIPEVGGIDYRDGNGLTYGADYPSGAENEYSPEVLMIKGTADDSRKAESFEIAGKIEEIVEKAKVYDREKKEYRRATYSDIAIITRAADNPKLEKLLNERAIPVEKSTNKGFFESFEIKLALNLLTIIDNPYQDIPFAAVLKSPIVSATSNDLAEIKIAMGGKNLSFFEGTKLYGKFNGFLDKLKDWHDRSVYMNISDFIEYVMDDSNLYNCLMAMPLGEVRKANIDLLKSKTLNYSRSSYSGLYNFIRYIEEIKKADVDYGNAAAGGAENSVKMMTIHKSKGLEFPFVFVADCGKQYSAKDISKPVLLNRKYYIGIEKRDIEKRLINKTLYMELIKEDIKKNQYAEEMRVFYVALTRAKEKLFISGGNTNLDSKLNKQWPFENLNKKATLPQDKIMDAGNYLFLTGLSLVRHRDGFAISENGIIGQDEKNPLYNDDCTFRLEIKDVSEIECEKQAEAVDSILIRSELEAGIVTNSDEEKIKRIDESLNYSYPHEEATQTIARVSPSSFETADVDHENSEEEKFKKFYKSGSTNAAERGNAYHKAFELLDYYDTSDLKKQIEGMVVAGKMPAEYAEYVEIEKIEKFLATSLGGRMKAAALDGKLKREQQFVAGFEDKGELRLMQGIIDAFFEETDGAGNTYAVLVDYKTDRNDDENHYINTYKGQLHAYADTIEKALGINVKEIYIYSVELGKAIVLK